MTLNITPFMSNMELVIAAQALDIVPDTSEATWLELTEEGHRVFCDLVDRDPYPSVRAERAAVEWMHVYAVMFMGGVVNTASINYADIGVVYSDRADINLRTFMRNRVINRYFPNYRG